MNTSNESVLFVLEFGFHQDSVSTRLEKILRDIRDYCLRVIYIHSATVLVEIENTHQEDFRRTLETQNSFGQNSLGNWKYASRYDFKKESHPHKEPEKSPTIDSVLQLIKGKLKTIDWQKNLDPTRSHSIYTGKYQELTISLFQYRAIHAVSIEAPNGIGLSYQTDADHPELQSIHDEIVKIYTTKVYQKITEILST